MHSVVPIVPAPPGRFTTTMGCPSVWGRTLAKVRPIMSVMPPAGHGSTRVIGFVGYGAAGTGGGKTAARARARTRPTVIALCMSLPLRGAQGRPPGGHRGARVTLLGLPPGLQVVGHVGPVHRRSRVDLRPDDPLAQQEV